MKNKLNSNTKEKENKPKDNRKRKFDFSKIKQEFFASEHNEVKIFFQNLYKTYNSHIRIQTKGWSTEKNLWKQEQAEIALNKAKKVIGENRAKAIISLENEIQNRVGSDRRKKMSHKELKTFWEILMTMDGQPTKVLKNYNTDTSALDKISEEERELQRKKLGL